MLTVCLVLLQMAQTLQYSGDTARIDKSPYLMDGVTLYGLRSIRSFHPHKLSWKAQEPSCSHLKHRSVWSPQAVELREIGGDAIVCVSCGPRAGPGLLSVTVGRALENEFPICLPTWTTPSAKMEYVPLER